MAKYRVERCYACGGDMKAAGLTDTWKMRIDGKLHNVPVHDIPCYYCPDCDISVLGQESDECVMYYRNKYIVDNNLNTPIHRIMRFLRYCWRRAEWWMYNRVAYRRRNLHMKTK
jgi:YgiT-type zinc finger domain-containing protein